MENRRDLAHERSMLCRFKVTAYNEPSLALWFSLEQLEARGLHENGRVDHVSIVTTMH